MLSIHPVHDVSPAILPLPANITVDPDICTMAEYWRSMVRSGETIPHRDDLDPLLDVPHLVPNVFLADALDGGDDFRIRLCGTRIADMLGCDSTGLKLSELTTGHYLQAITSVYRQPLVLGVPVYSRSEFRPPSGEPIQVERLTLPLRRSPPEAPMLMVIQKFHGQRTPVHGRFAQVIAAASHSPESYDFTCYLLD